MISVLPLFSFLFMMILVGFIIYFLISILVYIKTKSRHEQQVLEKLDEISHQLNALKQRAR